MSMDASPIPNVFPEVPALAPPSLAEFRELERAYEPLHFPGCLKDWELVKELSGASSSSARLAHLTGLIGSRPITYTRLEPAQQGDMSFREDLSAPNFRYISDRSSFESFAEKLTASLADSSRGVYYAQSNSLMAFPELLAGIGQLQFLRGKKPATQRVWIGSGGHVKALHFDPFSNFLCLMAGRKRISLFPFDVLPDVYPTALDRGIGGVPSSYVKLLHPDLERFPRFENALPKGRVVHLNAGDVLWIPPNWWHHVESFDLNVMVNAFTYDIEYSALKARGLRFRSALLTFADMPPDERMQARERFHASEVSAPGEGDGGGGRGRVETRSPVEELIDSVRFAPLPDYWRRCDRALYDHFVFQRNGDPIAALPGEFERMLERFRRRSLRSRLAPLKHLAVRWLEAQRQRRAGGGVVPLG